MAETKTYQGSCHCGDVRYEVTTDLAQVISCNCSICTKHGLLWSFTTPERFVLHSGRERLREYQFNKHVIRHQFCSQCGVESFAQGKKPDGSEHVAINVRCLDGVDIASLETMPFDGRSR